MRRTIVLLATVTLVLCLGGPAFGAWGGEPDGDRHPMVGAMYVDRNQDGQITWSDRWCSGSYAGTSIHEGTEGSDVFLTAAHCLIFTVAMGYTSFWVSFDSDPQSRSGGIPEGLIAAVAYDWDPRALHDLGNTYDMAVLLLPAGSVQGIAPVQLPTPGYLDGLKTSGVLQHSLIELVGYGAVPVWHEPGGPQTRTFDGVRRMAYAPVVGLTRAFLNFNMNTNATGLGGMCYGDSGSPQFVPGTRTIVSVSSVGCTNCNAHSSGYRLDTPGAREFLGLYLTLP